MYAFKNLIKYLNVPFAVLLSFQIPATFWKSHYCSKIKETLFEKSKNSQKLFLSSQNALMHKGEFMAGFFF